MKLLFWNLKGNPVAEWVKLCLLEHDIDIAIFCECSGIDFEKLSGFNGKYRYIERIDRSCKIAMMVKAEIEAEINREQSRYALYTVTMQEQSYIFAGVHLQDRRNYDSAFRKTTIRRMLEDIDKVQEDTDSKKIIIIADCKMKLK